MNTDTDYNDHDEQASGLNLPARKHHPGPKGTTVMNTKTKDELKEFRKDVIESVRLLIGQGCSYKQKQVLLAQKYGVSERQAKTYIKWFHEDFQKRKADEALRSYAVQKIRLEHLYNLNMNAGNHKEARECLKEIAALDDLNQKTQKFAIKSQIEVKNDLSHLSEDQLLQLTALLNGGATE